MDKNQPISNLPSNISHGSRIFSRYAVAFAGSAAAGLLATGFSPAILPVAGAAVLGFALGLLADKLNKQP